LSFRQAGVARAAVAVLAAAAALALQACGGDTKTLSKEETEQILREELPYRFEFRPVEVPKDASGALAGVAYGPHRTVVRFGISLGRGGDRVPLGPHTDLADATGGETFRVSSDMMEIIDGKLEQGRNIETRAQWRTSATMVVRIEDRLCKATEGKPCAI
jgi:hypothetical protein